MTRKSIPHAIGRLGIEKVTAPTHKVRNVDDDTRDPSKDAEADRLLESERLFVNVVTADVDIPKNQAGVF